MKTCFKCGITKSNEDFYRHPQMSDGRLGKCIDCTKRDVALRRMMALEQYRAYEVARNKTSRRIDQRREYLRNHRAKYPHKNRARAIVALALRTGGLQRTPREECGHLIVQAHHEDYTKPLEVRWLCEFHHKYRHAELKAQGVLLPF